MSLRTMLLNSEVRLLKFLQKSQNLSKRFGLHLSSKTPLGISYYQKFHILESYEAAVKSVNYHLRRTIGHKYLTFEEMDN